PKRFERAAVIAIALLALAACSRDKAQTERTVTVTKGAIEQSVSALGKLEPRTYVDVGAQVSGQLDKVDVEVGDTVVKDQLLAEIDARVIESRVQANQARVTSLAAQRREQLAQLELATKQHERNLALYERKLISADVRDTSAAALASAKARIGSLDAQIAEAKSTVEGDRSTLGYAKVLAPMPGTVVSLTAVEGQTLNATQVSPTILRIADLAHMTVVAQVAEADVGRLKPGMKAYFTTLGAPDRRWNTIVRQVQPTPTVLNDVVLFNVLLDVDNPDGALLPGMTAQVFFPQDRAQDVPLVPLAALEPAGRPGAFRARVRGPRGEESRDVVVGTRSRAMAEVVSGLEPGDKVILPEGAEAQQRGPRSPLGAGGGRRGGR
ncbi:MAG TPA: efflux RND transporter periplasmic adaptor subunit, partial [Xanthomonadales bacterium]|nr:efflux RND transporter periplasmic adaptor subunit [Xanthomonadales bacterium]